MTRAIRATCHCGAVEIHAEFAGGAMQPKRCNCSFCRRRQAGNIGVPAASVVIAKGADALTLYQFGTRTAQHYFCRHCGIYTHHRRRSDPSEIGINIGCIDGERPWDYEPMDWSEGIRHQSDEV